jgi:hypothetical protein
MQMTWAKLSSGSATSKQKSSSSWRTNLFLEFLEKNIFKIRLLDSDQPKPKYEPKPKVTKFRFVGAKTKTKTES